MLPAGMTASSQRSGISPLSGRRSKRWLPGTIRVAPLSAVKSVSAQIATQLSGTCGRGSGIEPSSAWNGWAACPGCISIAVTDATCSSGSSTASANGQRRGEQRHLGEERVA